MTKRFAFHQASKARGRNDWFVPAHATADLLSGERLWVEVVSRRAGNQAPIVLELHAAAARMFGEFLWSESLPFGSIDGELLKCPDGHSDVRYMESLAAYRYVKGYRDGVATIEASIYDTDYETAEHEHFYCMECNAMFKLPEGVELEFV